MDAIFDLVTLPFELIFESIECLFGCLFTLFVFACVVGVIFLVVMS